MEKKEWSIRQLMALNFFTLSLVSLGVYRYLAFVSINRLAYTPSQQPHRAMTSDIIAANNVDGDIQQHVSINDGDLINAQLTTEMNKLSLSNDEQLKEDRRKLWPFLTSSWEPRNSINGTIFNYLKEYKNPCWRENVPRKLDYSKNSYIRFFMKHDPSGQYVQVTKAFRSVTATVRQSSTRLRCLPAVYLAGVHKSGTTDFYASLTKHPLVAASVVKESNFWFRSLNEGFNFRDYVELYDPVAHKIKSAKDKRMITLDASPENFYMWNDTFYRDKPPPPNPRFAARELRALNPATKIIIMLRDPVTWLYSLYRHVVTRRMHIKATPEEFHKLMKEEMDHFNNCINQTNNVRKCAINRMIPQPTNVPHSIYYIYLKEWFKVFPREQILVIKAEEYYGNRSTVMRDVFTRFLDLPDLKADVVKQLTSGSVKNIGKKTSEMLDETKDMLRKFLAPHNKRLAELLGDDKFLWDSS